MSFNKANGLEAVRYGTLAIDEYLTGTGAARTTPDEEVFVDLALVAMGNERPLRSFRWSRVNWCQTDGERWEVE